MPPIQITRAEYEKKFGIKPIASSTSILEDEKPAPLRITRAEWNALQEQWKPQEAQGLGSKLKERGADILNSGSADRTLSQPMRPELRGVGALAGGVNDIISAAISPIIKKTTDALSDSPLLQKIATNKTVGKGLDATNKAIDFASDSWASFEEANPTAAQDIRDIANIASLAPAPRGVKPLVTKADDLIAPIKKNLDERGVNNVVKEIDQIENKYVKTRNANSYSKDIEASQRRIAESNVLDGSVDNNGLLQTKVSGGAIDQYKAQTIDGYEDIVRRKLADTKETALFDDVGKALKIEIGRSGLEAADLVTALKKIEKELEGLRIRTKGSSIIDLAYLQDAKIATTKNINYLTPPEKATYRKAVARAYKVLIEKNSTKFDVKAVNEGPLARAYEDIARLERLDGARAEGGRLGKATASLAGTAIGMVAGSAGGPLTAAAAGVVGGELAQVMKGAGMSRTFKGGGKGLTPDTLLVQTKLSIADKPMKAKAGIAKTKEIKELESQIAKNVADQKKAIKTGDFALVQALKEIYVVLVDELRKAVKYINDNASVGLSIKKSVTPESVAKKADAEDIKLLASVIDDVKNARLDPDTNRILSNMGLGRATDDELVSFAKAVFDEKDGVATRDVIDGDSNLVEEAKKYKSAEEFVQAQGTPVYHGTNKNFDVFDVTKKGSTQGFDEPGIFFTSDKNVAKTYNADYVPKPKYKLTPEEAAKNDKLQIKEVVVKESDFKDLIQQLDEAYMYDEIKTKPDFDGVRPSTFFDMNREAIKELLKARPELKGLKVTAEGQTVYMVTDASLIKTKSQLTEIWNKANRTTSTGTDSLATEAKKYKTAEEFVKAHEAPKTVKVWNKSKFSNDGAYADVPVVRKEEGITLYQGGSAEGRQFWTPDRKYAEQFGEVKEKTGTFYKIDNGNRVTDVYVEAPTKSQLTEIWNKANRKASEDER